MTMNDNDTPEMVCRFCKKPTTEHELFTLRSGRHWAHFECMLDASRNARANGKLDDVKMVLNWPDGVAEIRTASSFGSKEQRTCSTPPPSPPRSGS
jgi:hypothetical protein